MGVSRRTSREIARYRAFEIDFQPLFHSHSLLAASAAPSRHDLALALFTNICPKVYHTPRRSVKGEVMGPAGGKRTPARASAPTGKRQDGCGER